MFYEPGRLPPELRFDPFKAIVTPRPIGWISSLSADGAVNLAPYSFFNAVSGSPPCVMFSSDGWKHSVANIQETGEFVCNLATWALREQVNLTSATLPHGESEMTLAGLTPAPSERVRPPRVAEAPCALECRLLRVLRLEDLEGTPLDQYVVFGQVVGVHVDERYVRGGVLDTAALMPISRLGYREYAVVDETFEMTRPK